MAWHDAHTTVEGVLFDRESGLGAVPNGRDIEYLGLTVLMRPSVFLRLADAVDFPAESQGRARDLAHAVRDGISLAPPFLSVRLLDRERRPLDVPVVTGHDGRHRLMAAEVIAGDAPMPVQIFPVFLRSRHVNEYLLEAMRAGMLSQGGTPVEGPTFGDAWLSGRLHPDEPVPAIPGI